MKNIDKRIAAMGAAVMMMSSMAIGASAADSFSFYILHIYLICTRFLYS